MFNWLKKLFVASGSSVWTLIGGGAGSTSRIYLNKTDLEALFYGWVYACVMARSEDVGAIELFLLKRTKDGVEEIYDHPILSSLRGFNTTMTKSDGFALLSAHLDFFGRGYWRIVEDGGERTIIPLDPSTISAIEDDDGQVIGWFERKELKNGGQTENRYDLDEIVQFREMNPFQINGYYSIVQAAYEWIATELNATNWNKNFFENNAIPTTMLKTNKPIGGEAQKRLKTSFEEAFSGAANAHKVGVLPNGLEVVKLMESAKDMDFVALDERYQNKLLAMFRVPRTRLGITDDVNRANAEATDYIYASRAIKPRMKKLVDTLNEFYLPMFGESDYVLDFKSPVPDDHAAKIESYKAGLSNQPYMTVNEVRMQEGLPPIKGGDAVKTTIQFVDLGEVEKVKDVQPARIKEFQRKIGAVRRGKRSGLQAAKGIASDFLKLFSKAAADFSSRELDEQLHKEFVLRAEPYIPAVSEAMEKANKKIQKEVKDALPKLVDELKNKTITKNIEKDVTNKTLAIVVKATLGILTQVATEESRLIQENFSITGEYVISSKLNTHIDRFMNKLGRSYAETTVEEIKKEIKSGLEDGVSIRDIERRIRNNVFDGKMKVRSEMIAHSEVFRFSNLGLRDGYVESGVVATVRWYTAEDERVCEYCRALDGLTKGVEEPFFNKGQSVIGDEGGVLKSDYSEVFGGPLHPRCRCYVRPEKISIV